MTMIGKKFKKIKSDTIYTIIEEQHMYYVTEYCYPATLGIFIKSELEHAIVKGIFEWLNKTTDSSDCNHDFKQYLGFTQSYKYCIKCDHKE